MFPMCLQHPKNVEVPKQKPTSPSVEDQVSYACPTQNATVANLQGLEIMGIPVVVPGILGDEPNLFNKDPGKCSSQRNLRTRTKQIKAWASQGSGMPPTG